MKVVYPNKAYIILPLSMFGLGPIFSRPIISHSKFFLVLWHFQANFARAVASLSKSQAKKVARFLPNPEKHWGPKLRAGRTITSKHISLLGEAALNGVLNHEENNEEEPKSKKPKTEENNSTS
jgi:hypothetical protein